MSLLFASVILVLFIVLVVFACVLIRLSEFMRIQKAFEKAWFDQSICTKENCSILLYENLGLIDFNSVTRTTFQPRTAKILLDLVARVSIAASFELGSNTKNQESDILQPTDKQYTKVSFGIQITNGELWAFGLDRFGIGKEKFLLRLDELTLRGEHNLQNVSAALLTGIVQGFDMDSMLATAKTFKGLEHRLEFVTERRGVKFYNDSYSTTPDTAIAAVKSFSEPTYLILGGSEKFLDYSGLAAVLAKRTNLKGIFLIGQTGPRINEALIAAKFPAEKIMTSPKNLEEIFSRLQLLVEEGDVVLLSPATASFDMFPNYKERGNQFKQLSQRF
jgi:UDP-N-acetylmuramoylalanine-D-glutamate ligase